MSTQRMGTGTLSGHTESVFIRLHFDNGIDGCGEVATWNITREYTPAQIERCFADEMLPLLWRGDATEPASLRQRLDRIPGYAGLKAGIEMALYDALGRHLSVPLHRLLGGLQAPAIRLSYSVSGQDLDRELETIARCYQSGYRIFKIKLGILDVEQDVERLRRIAAVTPGAELRVDFNELAGRDSFPALCAVANELGIRYIEQPFPRGADHLLSEYVSSDVVFIADESCQDSTDVDRIADDAVYGAVSLKLTKMGGFAAMDALLVRAAGCGIQGYAGGSSESVFGVTAGVHYFCSRTGLIDGCDFYFPFEILGPQDLIGGVRPANGMLRPPDSPGIGCDVPDGWFS